jgi:RimJ/RimL family protein N-acetyltransferase
MIVTDERVAAFIGRELGFGVYPPWTAMGIERDGEIIGGVLFNCFENNRDVQATVAGKGFGKDFLTAVGDYIFSQLGYARITVKTEQTSVVRLAERLGGKIEGTLRSHFGEGRDGIIVGILKEEYKFRRTT